MVEEECYYVESVGGGVDENIPSTSFPHMLSTAHVHMPTFTLFIYHFHPSQMLKMCIYKFPTSQMLMLHNLLL